MPERIIIVIAALLFIFGTTGLSFAETDTQAQTEAVTQAATEEIINVGNKICPVSGEKIDEAMGPVTYEYEGKIYNFCCEMCIDEFKKDPQKYIKKVEEELQAVPGEGSHQEAETMHQGAHEGHQH